MALALAAIPGFINRAAILTMVALGITAAVYGLVALIVKTDDLGLALSRRAPAGPVGALARTLGGSLVRGMPYVLQVLAMVGTAAMIWVGGDIILHALEGYGVSVGTPVPGFSDLARQMLPGIDWLVGWVLSAVGSAIFGMFVGAASIPVTEYLIAPAWKSLATGTLS